MIVLSKPLFYSKIGPEVTCKQCLHPWTDSCLAGVTKLTSKCALGVFGFYLSIHLTKLFINRKKHNKKYLQKFIEGYLRSECFGLSFAFLLVGSICLMSKIFGRIYYHGVGIIPGFISGLSVCFESRENRLLNSVIWGSLIADHFICFLSVYKTPINVIESLFKNAYYFKILKYSPLSETLIFMVVSSLLMRKFTSKEKKIPINIWFYKPHLSDFILKNFYMEILKYFGIGYALSSVRSVVSTIVTLHKNSLKTSLLKVINKKHFRFALVFGGYSALFQGSLYFLKKYNKQMSSDQNTTLAGFLAGLSYLLKPTTNLLAIAIITLIQIELTQMPKNKKVEKIPVVEIFYMLCNAILFCNVVVNPYTCPNYYRNMLNIASGGLVDNVYNSLVTRFFIHNPLQNEPLLVYP